MLRSVSRTTSAGRVSKRQSCWYGRCCTEPATTGGRYYPVPSGQMSPLPAQAGAIPLWIGSWGSPAGLRRVARLGDGWLASAYNTTPAGFADGLNSLRRELRAGGREPDSFPHALVTMWTWVTEDPREAAEIIERRLAPLLNRDPSTLRGRLCVGPAQVCADSRWTRRPVPRGSARSPRLPASSASGPRPAHRSTTC